MHLLTALRRPIYLHHLRSLGMLWCGRDEATDYNGSTQGWHARQASHCAPPGSAYSTCLLRTMVALLPAISQVRASSATLHGLACRGHAW